MGSDSWEGEQIYQALGDDEFVITKREMELMLDRTEGLRDQWISLVSKLYTDNNETTVPVDLLLGDIHNWLVTLNNIHWSILTNALAHRSGKYAHMDVLRLPEEALNKE